MRLLVCLITTCAGYPATVRGFKPEERDLFSKSKYVEERTYRPSIDSLSATWLGIFASAAAIVVALAILVYMYHPELLFSKTTTTGGDTGAHHYVPMYLRDHLLPKGRITGWAPGWFAGFPALTFYFPLPALAIALLSYLIDYEIAFKLVSAAGPFLLPLAAFTAFKLLDFDSPVPAAAALSSVAFLLLESYSINGGNLLSTLAGEFGYSLAFALMVLSMALIWRAVRDGKFVVVGAVALSATALSHALPAMIATASCVPLIFGRGFRFKAPRFIALLLLSFTLTAFWSVPFMANLSYTAKIVWDQTVSVNAWLPREIRLVAGLAALGGLTALVKKERRLIPLAIMALLGLLLATLLPDGPIWRGRFLPFWYYSLFLFAAYAAVEAPRALAKTYSRKYGPENNANSVLALTITIAVFAALLLPLIRDSKLAVSWTSWNYTGYEGKESWRSYKKVNDYLKGLPAGRVMWEYSPSYGKYGTPRAFEMIPYWTGKPTMEGTLIESSISAPFHFINQAELSAEPTKAVPGIVYPNFDFRSGIKHLLLYDVKYLMLTSKDAKRAASGERELKLIKEMEGFSIYELPSEGRVVLPRYRPVVGKASGWRQTSIAWYSKTASLDIPLVFSDDDALSEFDRMSDLNRLPKTPIRGGSVSEVKDLGDEITFKTTALGQPHLVRVSYFPNWRVEGADGPYLTSPSIMTVIPRSERVRLYYGRTWADYFGGALTALALVVILAQVIMRKVLI